MTINNLEVRLKHLEAFLPEEFQDLVETGNPEGVVHQTPGVTIELNFEYKDRQFTRIRPRVRLRPLAPDDNLLTGNGLYREALRLAFEEGLDQAIPSWLVAPAVPSYLSSDPRITSVGGAFVIHEPSHFNTDRGWINANFSYCQAYNTQKSLGISMRGTKDIGGRVRLKVTAVDGQSPAALAKPAGPVDGFGEEELTNIIATYQPSARLLPGDVIYKVDGDDEAVSNPQVFSGYLASRSLVPDRRTTVLYVGCKVTLPDPDDPGKKVDVWMHIDFEVELRKVCRSAL